VEESEYLMQLLTERKGIQQLIRNMPNAEQFLRRENLLWRTPGINLAGIRVKEAYTQRPIKIKTALQNTLYRAVQPKGCRITQATSLLVPFRWKIGIFIYG